jgi:polysaccharide biosynthesis transport protein
MERIRAAEGVGTQPEGEDPVDLQRYAQSLRRSRLLIALIVIVTTGTAVALSMVAQKSYTATARIVALESTGADVGGDAAQRQLATLPTLISTPDILAKAAARVPGQSGDSVRKSLTVSVDPNASVVDVTGAADTPETAAKVANAVALVFIEQQRRMALERLRRARDRLVHELNEQRGVPGGTQQEEAIRQQLSALAVTEATTESDFELADPASPDRVAVSPSVVRNGILALIASLFLAALVAVAREQLRPTVRGARDLSRLTGLPLLARVPVPRPRLGSSRSTRTPDRPYNFTSAEHAAYESLETVLTLQAPPRSQHVVLVTSAIAGEGKTRITAGLGLALAQDGHNTLLVSADLRWPTLERYFEGVEEPGVADLLSQVLRDGDLSADEIAMRVSSAMPSGDLAGSLGVLSSGRTEATAGNLISNDALGPFIRELGRLDYAYVLLDAPPLLGVADARVLSRWCTNMLVVSDASRLTRATAAELADVLGVLPIRPLGLVVTGMKPGDFESPYGQRPRAVTATRR